MARPSCGKAALVAILAVLLSLLFAGCGGRHGGNDLLAGAGQNADSATPILLPGADPIPSGALGDVQGVIKGAAQPYELSAGWQMGDLPGTVPPAGLTRGTHEVDERTLTGKRTSAVDVGFATPGPHTLTASGQYPSASSYDYLASDMFDLSTSMDTGTNELHISGLMLVSNIQNQIYAEIGLVTESVYDLALSNANPSLMFNQSVVMLNALDAGTPFVAPLDYNGSGGTGPAQTYPGNSFAFDLKLMVEPANAFRGLAYLSVNGGEYLPLSGFTYGVDNWGWRPAESFAQCRLVAQLYSFNVNPAVVGSITFRDVRVTEGPQGGPSPHPWPYFGLNPQRTSLSPYNGPTNGYIKWPAFNAGVPIASSPALADDGTLYFTDRNSRLFALNSATGASKWAAPLVLPSGIGVICGPALSNGTGDGAAGSKRIYVGTASGDFFTIRDDGANGTIVNTVSGLGDLSFTTAVVSTTGRAFISSMQGLVYSFDSGGNLLWTSPGPLGFMLDPPALSANGTVVYVSTLDGHLYGLNAASGALLYDSGVLGSQFYCTPSVNASGLVYAPGFVMNNGPFWARNSDLSPNWMAAFAGVDDTYSKVGIGPSGLYFVGWSNGGLQAVDPTTHALKWSYPTGGGNASSPTVSANGNVYFGAADGRVYAVHDNGATASLLWSHATGAQVYSSPTIGPDGTLYIGSLDGKLYAFNDSGTPVLQIDCTALTNASFFVRTTSDGYLTAAQSTNTIYDASGLGLATGSQFYVSFDIDGVAQPSDKTVYPSIPVFGLVTVTAAGLTLPAPVAGLNNDLTDYFQVVGGGWILQLKPGAYDRVTNDLDSINWLNYTLINNVGGGTITGPWPTSTSASDTVVFASGVQYRPLYTALSYPLTGSTGSGRAETIYPAEHTTGWIQVNGFPAPGLAEGGTVLGTYYDQAGLTNTLQADAYCRFEVDLSVNNSMDFRVRNEVPPQPWIINNPPLSHLARPPDVLTFARGISFTLRGSGPFNSMVITVTPNKTLNNVTSITETDGLSATYTARVLPVRTWDDPVATNPDVNVSGTGPWNVVLNFLLQYGATDPAGNPVQTVQLDGDYGSSWNDGTAGRIYAVPGSPFNSNGLKSATVNINNQPAGTYTFAIRVTDSAGATYTYVWPTTVTLVTPALWQITTPQSANNVGSYASLCVVSGNPAIAYYDTSNSNLMFVRATDATGSTWGAPVTLDSANNTGQYPSLAIIGGNPAISYYYVTTGDLRYIRANTIDGSGAWAAVVNVQAVANDVGQYSSLAYVNARACISYYNNTTKDLMFMRASNATGSLWNTPGNPFTVESANDVGQYTSLAVVNGWPAISYYYVTGLDLRYSRATNIDGTAWPAAGVNVATAGNVGQYTTLRVVNSNPAISYYDASNGDLKYIRATDISGAGWGAAATPDATGDVGAYASLAVIGTNPAISYYDVTNGDLRYVRASDVTGTLWDVPSTVQSTGNVGLWTSLANLTSNIPGISYYDGTNGDLKYAFLP